MAFLVAWWAFVSAERSRLATQADLYRTALDSTLGKHAAIPPILAQDPFVRAALTADRQYELNQRLESFAAMTGLEAIYLLDETGLTLAASNHEEPVTFIGRNYGFRPYFRDALSGRAGAYYAVGATTNLPGFFMSAPVSAPGSTSADGVVAVKVDVSELSEAWAGDAAVIVSNESSVVLFASDPSWNYRSLGALEPPTLEGIRTSRQFGSASIDPLDWSLGGEARVRLAGRTYVHAVQELDRVPWSLHVLVPATSALQRALLTTGAVAGLLMLLTGGGVLRRLEQTRKALAVSQAARAELAESNEALAREIDDRRAAEARLEKAQRELARRSKLAALGQLAASVTHELGQPISAMKNHLAAAELNAKGRDLGLISRLGSLVERMEAISRDLRFFARPTEDRSERVDLRDVWTGASDLIAPDISDAGISLKADIPKVPVTVIGNRLRLEQVLVNLLRNAVSAVKTAPSPEITVTMSTDGDAVISIADNGPGIGDRTIEELQEPFHTTKASGEGMGLGLAISAAIVRDHGGRIEAQNGESGAVFHVFLPLAGIGEVAA